MKFKNKLFVNVYNEDSSYVRYVLHELGYVVKNNNEVTYINGGLVTENTGVWYTTFGRDEFKMDDPSYINCGYNIELFFALAAMRDDTDKNQLFVSETACSWVNIGMWRNKGDFELCLIDDYYMGENKRFTNRISPAHKASIDEIKDYFLLNPTYKPYRHWYEKTSVDAILRNLSDMANKIIKQDRYMISANQEIYDILKKQNISSANENDRTFFVMFQQQYIAVILSPQKEYKLMLWKNEKPFLFVDNDGIIHKIRKDYEIDRGLEDKN